MISDFMFKHDPLFLNLEIGCCVCIDWDIYFWDFERKAIAHTAALLQQCRSRLTELNDGADFPFKAYYQRSAKDNVHLWIRFDFPITILDSLLIRCWMGDDRTRLQLDAARYFRNGSPHEMNQCFDHKIENEKGKLVTYKAGEKIPLDYLNIPVDESTAEAHKAICNMQDECLKRKRQMFPKKVTRI